jgi:hypothetical protein
VASRLDGELSRWRAGSRRFRAFHAANADKIAKKLRTARDAEASLDVRAELEVALRLVADRRFEVAYEAYGVGRTGPDFTVTFRAGQAFNVEVTRLRAAPSAAALGRAVVSKLRQLSAGIPNVLLIAVGAADADVAPIAEAVRELRQRADRGAAAFLSASGYRDSRAFYDRFLRLGAVIVWATDAGEDEAAAAWVNPSARAVVPERALRALVASLAVDADSVSGGRRRARPSR